MASEKRSTSVENDDVNDFSAAASPAARKYHWWRGTFFNATILGICSFLAPGIWGAMNSLGAGGLQSTPKFFRFSRSSCLLVIISIRTVLGQVSSTPVHFLSQLIAMHSAGNALTFCLMVVSCFFGSSLANVIGIKYTLMFGTVGYARQLYITILSHLGIIYLFLYP